jgi:Dolichyl-phosphate-mannose-protein mannosyltransferase
MNEYKTVIQNRVRPSQLALLFGAALLLRISGLITFENWDENWTASVRILTGELKGGTSQTLPLINYLNAASFVVMYAIGRLLGVWHSTADFRSQYFIDRTPFIFAGRFVAASVGAFSAPLAALIAGRLGLTRRSSLIVGGMVAILPVNVWLSHFAKPDGGVASAGLLFVWSLLRKLGNPEAKGADVMVGVALAIVMSFKQTCLFLVAPALLGFVALLFWERKLSLSQITRGLLVSLLACVVAWAPMNIGILLDIPGFLDYQRAQVIVLTRNRTPYQIAQAIIPLIAGNVTGLTAAGMLAWLFAPVVRRDLKFLFLWISVAIAYVAFSVVSGGLHVAARYLLPFHELAFTLGCIAVLSLAEREGRSRLVGGFLTVAILASEAVGTAGVVKQATTAPMSLRCSEVLRSIAEPGRDKILTGSLYVVGLPIDGAALDDEHRRHERLAQKYGVKLPERAEERKTHRHHTADGYYVRLMPGAFGGMEDLTTEKAETAVKPFWWPIQEEEYKLDYWSAQGFNIFVVKDEAAMLVSTIPAFRSFHQQIKDGCEQVAVLPSKRELFDEAEIKVYRLRDHGGREAPTP